MVVIKEDSNIYLNRGKQLFTLLSGGLSFTFSYVVMKLIYMENNYSDSVRLKWGIKIIRIWDKNELLSYLKEKIGELKRSSLILDEKYGITSSQIKINSNEINKLVSNNSTIEGLNKSLDDLINEKTKLLVLELENNNSMVIKLIDYLSSFPSYYYWIGGVLAIGLGGGACYYFKEQLILRALIHLKNGLTNTNRGLSEAEEAISEANGSIESLGGRLKEVADATNNNISSIGILSNGLSKLGNGLSKLGKHVGIHQAVVEGLPIDQLKDKEIKELLKELLTADNLFTLLELSQLLLDKDGENFDKLIRLIDKGDGNVGSGPVSGFESRGRTLVRRGNITRFES